MVQLEFKEWQDRPRGHEILNEIRERTADIPGLIIELQELEAGPPTGKDIQIELSSYNPRDLKEMVLKVRQHLEAVEGLKDVDDSLPVPGVEWRLDVDRAQASQPVTKIKKDEPEKPARPTRQVVDEEEEEPVEGEEDL